MGSELKTKQTDENVIQFLELIEDKARKADCYKVLELMKSITKCEPKMWGASIVGFGNYHYKYASGREGDWFLLGFSPRKQNLTIYGNGNCQEGLIEKAKASGLGKFKNGKACMYVNKLQDIDMKILKKILTEVFQEHGK